jgi:hypothetical protein
MLSKNLRAKTEEKYDSKKLLSLNEFLFLIKNISQNELQKTDV